MLLSSSYQLNTFYSMSMARGGSQENYPEKIKIRYGIKVEYSF